jgi:uracil-DNA glycosylase
MSMVIVGEAPKWGEPFSGREGQLLDACLRQAGIRRERCTLCTVGPQLPAQLAAAQPGVIITLGDAAARAVVPNLPPDSIQKLRGYAWESPHARIGVLTTVSLDAIDKEWVPWSPLFARDLTKAKEMYDAG